MLEFESARIEGFATHINYVGDRALNPVPVFEEIVDKILVRERRMFETRGASSGVYWSPLAPSTIARKQGTTFHHKRGGSEAIPYPERPLWRYGNLMRSLSERGAPHQILHVDRRGIEFGSSHEAAAKHARGTEYMPARPPLIIPKKHAHEYIGMLNKFIFGETNER